MGQKRTKNDLQLLYKARYGEEAFNATLYFGYNKRDYEEAIRVYDLLDKEYSEKVYEHNKIGRTLKERTILKNLNKFI